MAGGRDFVYEMEYVCIFVHLDLYFSSCCLTFIPELCLNLYSTHFYS